MKRRQKKLWIAIGWLAAFALWTALVCAVDVQPIGPLGSAVGFASVNAFAHRLTGVHVTLYHLTDWLSIIPVGLIGGFALLGMLQWMRRKKLWKVDRSILALGGFYLVVMACYLFFELCVINERPVLIEGVLEASYPSSTTVLVLCVMPTAVMQLRTRIKNKALSRWTNAFITLFAAMMVTMRVISGVHWLTDIIGGALLSGGLVMLYDGIVCWTEAD